MTYAAALYLFCPDSAASYPAIIWFTRRRPRCRKMPPMLMVAARRCKKERRAVPACRHDIDVILREFFRSRHACPPASADKRWLLLVQRQVDVFAFAAFSIFSLLFFCAA